MSMVLYGVVGLIVLVAIIAVIIIATGNKGNKAPQSGPPVVQAGQGFVAPPPPPEPGREMVPLSADQRAMLYHGDRPALHVTHTPFDIGRKYPGRLRQPDIDTEQFIGLYGSRKHAAIFYDFKSGQFYLEDQGSKNGTFVNERLVEAGRRHILKDQDKIWITDKLELIFKDPRSVGKFPTVGQLRIMGLVAKGGMAEVFKGQDNEGRFFAVKVPIEYTGESEVARQLRLEDEHKILASVSSPRIPRVYELTRTHDGRQALIMEFLSGQTLRTFLQTNKVDVTSAIAIVGAIADGLKSLHASGYVHCDIKPDNIMMRQQSGSGGDVARNAMIIDFGIATPDRSMFRNPFGSANYQSPEHIKGELLTFKSDVYSLGCVLYELLTDGERLFPNAENLEQIKQFQVNTMPVSPSEAIRRKNVPKAISPEADKLTMDMLDKSAGSRPDLNSVLSRIARLAPNVV